MRRFSQAIAEGDGISLVVEVDTAASARAAEDEGADALVVRRTVDGLREATALPLLWCAGDGPQAADAAGADAWLLVAERVDEDDAELERLYRDALERGLECVLEVRTEEELERVLESVDPEVFLLGPGEEGETLDHVLELLPSVPAGKLAIASIRAARREQVAELERAGVDGVVVAGNARIAELVAAAPPEL